MRREKIDGWDILRKEGFDDRARSSRILATIGDSIGGLLGVKRWIRDGERVWVFPHQSSRVVVERGLDLIERCRFVGGLAVCPDEFLLPFDWWLDSTTDFDFPFSLFARERLGSTEYVTMKQTYGSIIGNSQTRTRLSPDDFDLPPIPDWIPEKRICVQPSTASYRRDLWSGCELVAEMIESELGVPVVVLGGPEDEVDWTPRLGVNAVGRLTLPEAMAVAVTSEAIVGLDSWLTCCGGAFGIPTVAVWISPPGGEMPSYLLWGSGGVLVQEGAISAKEIVLAIRERIHARVGL